MANEEKVKFRRLVKMDRLIREETYLNAEEMAKRLDVSSRTIKRDIDELRLNHDAPIEYDTRRRGYYYSERDYFLPALHMRESDLFSLVLTTRILEQYKDTPLYNKLDSIIRKISQYLPDKISVNPLWLDQSFSYLEDRHSKIDPTIWESVFRALQDKKVLKIRYNKPGEKENAYRKIKIYHIVCHKNEWYLIAWSNISQDIRFYVVSRIQKADLLKDDYIIPEDFNFKDFMGSNFGIYPHEKDYKVELKFSAEIAHLIREKAWNLDWTIDDLESGGILVKMTVGHLLEIKRWVLSWGKDVQVLDPEELRELVAGEVTAIKQQYSDSVSI